MSKFSDNKKPQTSIFELLPEVYKSNVNKSVFGTAFDRHLSKDDTSRVTGFIGEPNPNAITDRRIKEVTPHRQAFQLAPTMISTVGTETHTLSYQAFLQQLNLMGVDVDRLPLWGDTLQFNWVPPVNIDMLVNYQDYYWKPTDPLARPQYFTVENRCNKATSKVKSYENMIIQRGANFSVKRTLHETSELVIAQKYDDLFVPGFIFYTKNSYYTIGHPNINMQDQFWTVVSSSYDSTAGETIIKIVNKTTDLPLVEVGTSYPVTGDYEGVWFYHSADKSLVAWESGVWVQKNTASILTISLSELLQTFQAQANCTCNEYVGWDTTLWDDNPESWIPTTSSVAPASPTNEELWYDLTSDTLKQYDTLTASWIVLITDVSTTPIKQAIEDTSGTSLWDKDAACVAQTPSQWTTQNQWVHKSELDTTSGASRAQLPILEYNSTAEMNEWVQVVYPWKYRSDTDGVFETTPTSPKRLELEPIKGYYTDHINGVWTMFLFHQLSTMYRDVDYTDTFVPGYGFRITDDTMSTTVYTVASSEYREITTAYLNTLPPAQATNVLAAVGTGVFCTIVQLSDSVFNSPQEVYGPSVDPYKTRIEPITTSMGDAWRGYHIHWLLDEANVVYAPVSHQPVSPYYQQALTDEFVGTSEWTSWVGTIQGMSTASFGVDHVEITFGFDTSSTDETIVLPPYMWYNSTIPQHYAVVDSGDLRVFINGVRQYGTYTDVSGLGTSSPSDGVVNFTVIGTAAHTGGSAPTINYAKGITLRTKPNPYDVIRIEVGAASIQSMGDIAIPVRTIADDTTFATGVSTGDQPVYRSLNKYQRHEQSKTSLNQYPLFNVYDVDTSEVIDANQLFGYKEDPSYTLNISIQRRISASSDGKEYMFEQRLRAEDTDVVYAYKLIDTPSAYWYSPSLGATFHWDGYTWTNTLVITTATGIIIRHIITSDVQPTTTQEYSMWLDTTTATLYQYAGGMWTTSQALADLTVNNTDPLLSTIWKRGINNERYVPQYVDSTGAPISPVGNPEGDWEVVDQWIYNPEHKNNKDIKYTQLVSHLRSIVNSQPKIPGLQGGGLYTLSQSEFNYGIGGTIKEHNEGFDTLISAVNVNNVTPVGVIEFASQEYASCILRVRDLFRQDIVPLLSNYSKETMLDFTDIIVNTLIDTYENNDYTAQVYGDTTAYDGDTHIGVQNWIATIPMFGLGVKYQPYFNMQGGSAYIFHHDGHRSVISFTPGEYDNYARLTCATPDPRLPGGKLGFVSTSGPAGTRSAFETSFGSEMRTGVYWYTTGASKKLYRFELYDTTFAVPSVYDINGSEIPDGIKYFDLNTNSVFRKSGLSWVQDITVGDPTNNISTLWKEVDLTNLLASTIVEIEQRLYDITPDYTSLVYDYSHLTQVLNINGDWVSDVDEQATYNYLREQRFDEFVSSHNITSPLVNVDYEPANAFTWNYVQSMVDPDDLPRRIFSVEAPASTPFLASCWQELYTRVYGTPYPHLEPWILQGYTNKPTWWDEEYRETNGSRRWKYTHSTTVGMWENIRLGVIPPGKTPPSTPIPTYSYFSVNISDDVLTANGLTYGPDALLPPYIAPSQLFPTPQLPDPYVRSLFVDQHRQIVSPSADYAFGDGGPTEWMWSVSSQHPYDLPVISFLMQPVKFLHAAFGPTYTSIQGLQVDTLSKHVYSHESALFHGDVYGDAEQYSVPGLNQWYVNYNRYTGFDTNTEFRELWVGWKPRMTYQFGGIVDTSSFDIGSKYFDVSNQDYSIVLANNGVVQEAWADAFEVSLLNIPPAIVQYNNQSLWKLEIDSLAAIPRNISYYGVRHYPTTVDVTTNTFTANSVSIAGVNLSTNRFLVQDDHTQTFMNGTSIQVSNAGANNGTYTVSSSTYDSSSNRTQVVVSETIPSSTSAGTMTKPIMLPWQTGDVVVMSTSKFLPAPLKPDTGYYIIRTSDTTYQLAESPTDAAANLAIVVSTIGTGGSYVSQVDASFNVFGGNGNTSELWFHYTIDRNDIRTFAPPYTIMGMQTLINMIDGYDAIQADAGITNNGTDANDFDTTTGRLVNWQLETERFIDWAYGLRQSRIRVNDKYEISTSVSTSQFTFTNTTPYWLSGTAVVVTTTGTLPSPLIAGSIYHMVLTGTPGVFKLSLSANAADTSSHIVLDTQGSGQVYISLYDVRRTFPRFEINPYRNNVWMDTPVGVLADVIQGPYADIRVQQTLFDQYSRPLTPDQVTVYREDLRCRISARPNMTNDMDLIYTNDPYNYLHIGGGHMFVEGYEHFLVFNDYTTGGSLIYDSFLGLWVKRFNLDYFEKTEYTLRPTLGGYYLIDGQFKRNMEGAIDDMRAYYDVLTLSETSNIAPRARGLLGYRGRASYLDLLNVNTKAQFMFYRGMIQAKGSVNSVQAYINSRRFVDAKMDEYWAWKIAEFGDAHRREFPEVNLFATDNIVDDIRLVFLASTESESDTEVVSSTDKGFNVISYQTPLRWNVFPEQKQDIGSALFLDAEVTTRTKIYAATTAPTGMHADANYWLDSTVNAIKVRDTNGQWVPDTSTRFVRNQDELYDWRGNWRWNWNIHHDCVCDDFRAVRYVANTNNFELTLYNVSTTGDTFQVYYSSPSSLFSLSQDTPVYFKTTTGTMPYPLVEGQLYYVNVVAPHTYSLSTTVGGQPINITYAGSATVKVIPSHYTSENYSEVIAYSQTAADATKVNASCVRFPEDTMIQYGAAATVMVIYTINSAKSKISPAKFIDKQTDTVVQQVPIWHPAAGHHSHVAIHNVDLQNDHDPARYNTMINSSIVEANNWDENYWNHREVGTIWLDGSLLGYTPYYDDTITPNVNDRLYGWGKLAPWGDVKVYEWVESTVPPAEWTGGGTPRTSTFYRVRSPAASATFDVGTNTTTILNTSLSDGDEVQFYVDEDGTLPGGLLEYNRYILHGTYPRYTIEDPIAETTVVLTSPGSGMHAFKSFTEEDWVEDVFVHDTTTVPQLVNALGMKDQQPQTTRTYTSIRWKPTDMDAWTVNGILPATSVDVYVNGVLAFVGLSVSQSVDYLSVTIPVTSTSNGIILKDCDIIDLIRPIHVLSKEEEAFNPDESDDPAILIQWTVDYNYSTNSHLINVEDVNSSAFDTYFYFWVEQSTARPVARNQLSTAETAAQIRDIPTPYLIVQRPRDIPSTGVSGNGYPPKPADPYFTTLPPISENTYMVPVMYREAVVRGVSGYINDDDRYAIRFTCNHALRDTVRSTDPMLKNKHEEWLMFRKAQPHVIPRELWDRLTEALVGYKLADPSIRVPSLERELYDSMHDTDTQYGLGIDQAFVNKTIGMATIVAYLQDSTHDFSPVDINAFLNMYTFDTAASIVASMEAIYTTLNSSHVNAIWFDVLNDSLSLRGKYKELMKTSWVSLHGIRVLEVGGLFDD